MFNPFLCNSKQLSQHWRTIREQLTDDKSDLEHLNIVSKFWSYAPISAPFLNWDNPSTWPTPWELIAEMNFDQSAVALGMEYTLLLANDQRWNSTRLELNLACLNDKSQQLLILIVDSQHVLNFEYGLIVSAEYVAKEIMVQQRYQYQNKIHKII